MAILFSKEEFVILIFKASKVVVSLSESPLAPPS
jgi:hypothetical protein